MSHCSQCPRLQAQIAQQQRTIDHLRRLLQDLIGGLRGTAEFIDRELTEPTMPRRNLVPAVYQRLTTLLYQAEGKRV
jgi:hypothetical protein